MYHHGGINSYWTRKPNYVYARERVSMRQAFAREEERSRARERVSERANARARENVKQFVRGGGWFPIPCDEISASM